MPLKQALTGASGAPGAPPSRCAEAVIPAESAGNAPVVGAYAWKMGLLQPN